MGAMENCSESRVKKDQGLEILFKGSKRIREHVTFAKIPESVENGGDDIHTSA